MYEYPLDIILSLEFLMHFILKNEQDFDQISDKSISLCSEKYAIRYCDKFEHHSNIASRISQPTDVIKTALSKTSPIFKRGISQHTKIDNRFDLTRKCVRGWLICVHAGDICVSFCSYWGQSPCKIHRMKYRKRVTAFIARARVHDPQPRIFCQCGKR